jgi:hypothetical protein
MVLVAPRAALMAPGPTATMTLRCDELASEGGKALVGIIRGEGLNAEVTPFYEPELRQFRKV